MSQSNSSPQGFHNVALAARTRKVVRKMATKVVNEMWPPITYGVVQVINHANRVCMVQTPNADPLPYRMGSVHPVKVGDVVRIAGPAKDRYIQDVMGPSAPFNPHVAQCHLATAVAIGTNLDSVILPFDSIDEDDAGGIAIANLGTTSVGYSCPVDGRYHILAHGGVSAIPASGFGSLLISIIVNAQIFDRGEEQVIRNSGAIAFGDPRVTYADIVSLNQGDYVQVALYQSFGVTLNTTGGIGAPSFTIKLDSVR